MLKLASSILERDQILERLTAHPFTLFLGSIIVFAQATVMVGEVAGFPFARWLALDANSFHLAGIFFPISHYPPLSEMTVGAGFAPMALLSSILLFSICGASLLICGPEIERTLGTRRTAIAFVIVTFAHAVIGKVLGAGLIYGALAFCTWLVTSSLLIQLESRSHKNGAYTDTRMALLIAAGLLALMCAGFLREPVYLGLIAAVGVGPTFAVMGHVLNRRLEVRAVKRKGSGKVGSLYFVDETDLLTREEVQARMDVLLDKIASRGLDGLLPEERQFLTYASKRLKETEGV
ncbi:MAG: hypothetical protein L3J82_00205 [Planctomycetes bacterium]|nr:hypothetical protein [Planctomycetota bacterium]